jgi:hypothetical protein
MTLLYNTSFPGTQRLHGSQRNDRHAFGPVRVSLLINYMYMYVRMCVRMCVYAYVCT